MLIEELFSQMPGLKYIGPAVRGEKDCAVKIVFSDAVTVEARSGKPDLEFPLSLNVLEDFLRRKGCQNTDYAFLPPPEAQVEMQRSGQRLATIGVRRQTPYPVKDAHIWAINMMNYLQTPALLRLFQLAGVPALRQERDERSPLVVLGGNIFPNPLPLSAFYDVLAAGDGEEVLSQIAGCRQELGPDRPALLAAIARLEGTYVPGYTYGAVKPAQIDFADPEYAAGSSYLVNRSGAILLARGCPYACAFCKSCITGGDYRVKPFSQVIEQVDRLSQHGARKIMLIAASAASYRSQGKTVMDVIEYIHRLKITPRLMSDRPENASTGYFSFSVKARGKVILAPEASPSIRLHVLRKTMSEENLEQAIEAAIKGRVNQLQLYVILCIPAISPGVVDYLPDGFAGERLEDVQYLADLGMSIARRMRRAAIRKPFRKPYVALDCMPFIPAIGAPLQRAAFPSFEQYLERLALLKSLILPEFRSLVAATAGMKEPDHLLELFMNRSQAQAGLTLQRAWLRSPGECLDVDLLRQEIQASGYDMADFYKERVMKPGEERS